LGETALEVRFAPARRASQLATAFSTAMAAVMTIMQPSMNPTIMMKSSHMNDSPRSGCTLMSQPGPTSVIQVQPRSSDHSPTFCRHV
jgi:hypothetical protein